jgi:hypothetical protein
MQDNIFFALLYIWFAGIIIFAALLVAELVMLILQGKF